MFKRLSHWLFGKTVDVQPAPKKPKGNKLKIAAIQAQAEPVSTGVCVPKAYAIQAPTLPLGVVPAGVTAPIAMDSAAYSYAGGMMHGAGFPGYPYLSQLATRPEFRAMAGTLSTELTREWIELVCSDAEDVGAKEKLEAIETELERLGIRSAFQAAAEHDAYFGRAQLMVDIEGADRSLPLILDPRTVRPGSLKAIRAIEPMWTTPSGYDASDPLAADFYRPSRWFVLGQQVHASRLMTIISRPVPDILKPAYNFGGISLSQLAEPYVDNWLRTRQSVSDLLNNFSITALATSMDQVLQGDDDGSDLFARASLFTSCRSNKGLMLLDKEQEELIQINTPLSGLHELQAQAQEHMCSVSRTPAIVLTGISPSGLNASSDGEIRIFYDWIAAQQEAHYREPLETVLQLVQLNLFGEIDPRIGFVFRPLYQMDAAQEADIRLKNSQAAVAYIDVGVLDPSEERERLARDPVSGYQGLDVSKMPEPREPEPTEFDNADSEDQDGKAGPR